MRQVECVKSRTDQGVWPGFCGPGAVDRGGGIPCQHWSLVTLIAALRVVTIFASTLVLLLVTTPLAAVNANAGAEGAGFTRSDASASDILIGFVGGFVRHDDARHGPVQLAQRMRGTLAKGTYVRVFEN